jgi:hypothetical protein
MKSFMIFGAIIGFLTGAGLSVADDCAWPTALWRACAAALLIALFTRWWSRIWLASLRHALNQRRHTPANPASKTKPASRS